MSEPHDAGPRLPNPPSWYDARAGEAPRPAGWDGAPDLVREPSVRSHAVRGRPANLSVFVAVVSLLVFTAIAVVLLSRRGGGETSVRPPPAEELVDYQEPPPPAQSTSGASGSADAAATDEAAEVEEGWDQAPELANAAAVVRAMDAEYPPLLRDAGVTGNTNIRFRIRADGSVDAGSLRVEATTHDDFARAALRVVPRMRFRPGRRNGRAATGWVTIPVQWRIAP